MVQLSNRLLDDLPDALIVSDLEGVIQIWNKKAETIFRICKDDAIGKSLDIIIPDKLRKAHWIGFDRAVLNGSVKQESKPVRTKALLGDGSTLIVEMAFSLSHDLVGRLVGVIATARLPM